MPWSAVHYHSTPSLHRPESGNFDSRVSDGREKGDISRGWAYGTYDCRERDVRQLRPCEAEEHPGASCSEVGSLRVNTAGTRLTD